MLLDFVRHHKLLSAFTVFAVSAFSFIVISISELNLSLIESRSKILLDDKNNIIAYSLSSDTQSLRFLTRKEDVADIYLKMLIANEDNDFYSHMGVNLSSLIRATFSNIHSNKITSGGSTIAMQVAKRLTHHKRTYLNKLKEIVQAIYLTSNYGRDKVISFYLTTAPFGSNIEGVNAASLKWFNHSAKRMTPSEAALLTALPRAPEKMRPDKNLKAAFYYKNEVLKLSYLHKVIDKDVLNASLEEDIPNSLYKIDAPALTLANKLFYSSKNKEIKTYLNSDIQRLLNDTASNYERLKTDNAVLSIIVLDSLSKKVVGLLGSSDVKESQICLPFSLRSPGSTLKPFAYGQAFAEGRLHPATILHDDANLYGTWSPVNFNKSYKGQINAFDALRYSLNLPAIEVIDKIGADSFVSLLNTNEKKLFLKNNKADLSVVLGSGNISLFSLTKLYAMLNNDGLYSDFKLTTEQNNLKSYRLLTKASARAVYEILATTPRPLSHPQVKNVSYKTGTSYKFKDALAIGSFNQYTVGVAIRYPDNKVSTYHNTGYKDAAPILFSVITSLPQVKFNKEIIDDQLLDKNAPLSLKELSKEQTIVTDNEALKIVFPSNGDVITPDYNGNVFIRYKGGVGKVYLMIDDNQTDNSYFKVDEEGFYKVSVFDEKGHSDYVKFKVILK